MDNKEEAKTLSLLEFYPTEENQKENATTETEIPEKEHEKEIKADVRTEIEAAEQKPVERTAKHTLTKGCNCESCVKIREYQKNYQRERRNKNPDVENINNSDKPIIGNNGNAATPETAEEKMQRELNEAFKQEATQTQQANPTPSQPTRPVIDISEFINGYMLLMCLDYSFPLVTKYVVGFFNKKYKHLNDKGVEALKLTTKEWEKLEPMADAVVKVLFYNMPPEMAFLLMYCVMSFGKISMLNEKHFDLPVKPNENDK